MLVALRSAYQFTMAARSNFQQTRAAGPLETLSPADLVSNLRLVHSCLKYFGKSLKHYFTLTEIRVFTFYGLM